MLNKNLLASILLILAVMFAQVGNAAAAPQTQDTTPITGTIETITTETDAEGVTTVVVEIQVDETTTQTVRLDLDTAAGLGLVDSTTLEVNEAQIGQSVTVEPTDILPDEEPVEPDVHPISMLLAKFFFGGQEDLGLTYEMASLIDSMHTGDNEAEQVFGFGVIAQALWMARDTDGNADIEVAEDILIAKQSKDYEAFFEAHPEYREEVGDNTPSNWGQFKKVLREKKENLGTIVSGQAEDSLEDDSAAQQNQGNGQDKQDKDKKEKKEKKDKKEKKP